MFKLDRIQYNIIESKLNKHNWKRVGTQEMYKRLPLPENHIVYSHPKYYPNRSIIVVKKPFYTEFFLPRKISWAALIELIELQKFPSNKKSF